MKNSITKSSLSHQIQGKHFVCLLFSWALVFVFNTESKALISSVTNKTILHTVFDVSSPQVGSIYIQRGITNRIEVKGSYIDLTSEIEIFGGGQRMLGTKISNSPFGASPAVLVFDFRSTTTGHHTVVLKRINGEDRFGMASALAPGIIDIRYYTPNSQVALPAPVILPRNTRIRMVVMGNNIGNLEYTPNRSTFYNSTIPLVTSGDANTRTYEFITKTEGSLTVSPLDFKTKFSSTDKLRYDLFIGNKRWDPAVVYKVTMSTN